MNHVGAPLDVLHDRFAARVLELDAGDAADLDLAHRWFELDNHALGNAEVQPGILAPRLREFELDRQRGAGSLHNQLGSLRQLLRLGVVGAVRTDPELGLDVAAVLADDGERGAARSDAELVNPVRDRVSALRGNFGAAGIAPNLATNVVDDGAEAPGAVAGLTRRRADLIHERANDDKADNEQ